MIKHEDVRLGQLYKETDLVYKIIKRIDTQQFQIGGCCYVRTYGKYLAEDQYGHKHIIDINKFECVDSQ